MTKIAIVTDAWHPQINGVVTTLSKTIFHLGKLGFKIQTITPEHFRSIPCPSYNEKSLALAGPKSIDRVLKNFKPNCVHIVTEGPLDWAARSIFKREKFGFSSSCHTRFPEYVHMRWPVPLSLSYRVQTFHGLAGLTMVATKALMEELTELGFENLVLWSRGVDCDFFKPAGGYGS